MSGPGQSSAGSRTRHVLAHDVGTSSLKTALVTDAGEVVAQAKTPYGFVARHPGWFEQSPEDYWQATLANTRQVLAASGVDRDTVAGMVFSTQAMGIIPVDAGGTVLHPNIAWVDGRAEAQARSLMRVFGGPRIFRALVGIEITGKDVLPKLKWLKETEPAIYRAASHVLDVNGYLKFRATGRRVAEWSGACSYGFDLKRKDWARIYFRAIGFDLAKLPSLVRSTDRVGTLTAEAARELDLPRDVPVFGGCDDTQSAALGSGARHEGAAHIYLGSSAWAGVSTARPLGHRRGAVCLQSGDPAMNFVVGITESAGAHLDWFLGQFYAAEKAAAGEAGLYELVNREIARIPAGSDHLVFTPWLQGERCPVSTTTTRGTLFNLGLEHTRAHVLRALLEGIAFNLRWTLDQFGADYGFRPERLRAIGGGTANDAWLQGIADITGRIVEAVERPTLAGAVGAAACALVGAGLANGFDVLDRVVRVRREFTPDPARRGELERMLQSYRDVYAGLAGAYRRANAERFRRAR